MEDRRKYQLLSTTARAVMRVEISVDMGTVMNLSGSVLIFIHRSVTVMCWTY